MVDFPNKSQEFYKNIEGDPLLSLDVDYVYDDESKASLLSVCLSLLGDVPQVLSFPSPLFFIPFLFITGVGELMNITINSY